MSTAPPLTWTIGDVTITRVEERVTALPPDVLVPGITPELIEGEHHWVTPFFTDDHRMLLSLHTFVVESKGLTVVVDTCVGADYERPLPCDASFIDRLDEVVDGGRAGVDVVLCTHLHFDHVGWNTIVVDGRPVPTFPNARYLFGRVELDALAEHERHDQHDILDVAVRPVIDAGLADLVETDHRITDEIRLVATPGHTPGHVSVVIESGAHTAMITGDVAHTPLQFAHPELTASPFDHDPAQAITTRRSFVERLTGSATLLLGTHFPPPTAGRIIRGDNGSIEFDTASAANERKASTS